MLQISLLVSSTPLRLPLKNHLVFFEDRHPWDLFGMRKSKNKCLKLPPSHSASFEELLTTKCLEGEQLSHLLQKLDREMELAKQSSDGLPEKIWNKQQFSIGVNEVTRVLERMPKVVSGDHTAGKLEMCNSHRPPSIRLQVVLLAVDCNPKMLIKHIPSLASSRGVPIICIRDNRGGSLRLGELVKLKTAMAIGVKCRGSRINAGIDEILHNHGMNM